MQDFLAIVDRVIALYKSDHRIIFRNDAERNKYHFENVHGYLKRWKKSHRCVVPDCVRRSIVRSHTISKGMLLDRIAEAGHVLTPSFDHVQGKIRIERIGASDASTFPGFCKEHENLFVKFENAKEVSNEREALLQAYRAACRELFRTRFYVAQLTKWLKEFTTLRDSRLKDKIRDEIAAAGLKNVDISELRVDKDPLLLAQQPKLDALHALNSYLELKLLPELDKAVFSPSIDHAAYIRVVAIDIMFPFALSGAASFDVSQEEQRRTVNQVIGVVPQLSGSVVFFIGLEEDEDLLDRYYNHWLQNALTLLSMVESWMINGTDQWYIKPSIWMSLGTARQEVILQAIYDSEQSIADEPRVSVFDDLRSQLLLAFQTANRGRTDKGFLEFVQLHASKLAVHI